MADSPSRSARAGNFSFHVVYGQKGQSATLLRPGYGRFSFKKCARGKFILPCRIGKKAPLCYGRFSFKKCSCRKFFFPCRIWAKGKKRHFVTAGFPLRSARAGNVSCHVVYGQKGKSATLLRQIILQEVLVPETSLSMSYMGKGEKAPLCYGRFSFKKCARRKFILPCRIGKESATLLRQIFLQEVLVPEIFLSMSYMGKRDKAPLCYGRFSFKKCARRKCILPCRIGKKAPLCYGRFSFKKCSCRKVFLTMSYMGKREKAPLCYGRFSFKKCARRKCILPCRIRKQSATLLRQIFLQEVLVPESFFNHVVYLESLVIETSVNY